MLPVTTAGPRAWLSVSVDLVGGGVVLSGELDRDSSHHVVDALAALRDTHHRRWTVDTAAVTWCDAGGLRALATGHALAVACGRELRLVRTSRCVERLLRISGLAERVDPDRARRPSTLTVLPAVD